MKTFQQFQEEGSHGEKVKGEFMSYATMKAKGIKPRQTAVQKVIHDTIRPAQGRPKGQNKSDHANRHSAQNRPETPARTMQRKRHDPRDETQKRTQGRYSDNSRMD